jgi:hypothetical protein
MNHDSSKNNIYNYVNYYLLQTDIEREINTYNNRIIFWAEVVAIGISLFVFYLDFIIQVFGYYFFGPSLTKKDRDMMEIQRALLNSYSDIKSKYILVCTTNNTLGFKEIATNIVTEALTLSNQVIPNCSQLTL